MTCCCVQIPRSLALVLLVFGAWHGGHVRHAWADSTGDSFTGESDVTGALNTAESSEKVLDEFDDPADPFSEPSAEKKARERWKEFKDNADDKFGVRFGVNYAIAYQGATESSGVDQAAGGRFQFIANWTAIARETAHPGSFAFKLENRHRFGNVSLQRFHTQLGVAGSTAFSYSDFGWGVLELNYTQELLNQRLGIQVGAIQPITYLDVYPLVSPMSAFLNQSFSFNPTIAIPAAGMGVAAGGRIWRNLYFISSVSDGNAKNESFGWDTLVDHTELFKHVEVGWALNEGEWKEDNVHVTVWHVDERTVLGRPEGWGVAVSYAQNLGPWLPYVRAGYSEDGGVQLERMFSVGLGRRLSGKLGLLGFGSSWGRAPEPDPEDQYTIETFWRTQITPSFEVTPDLQMIFNPAYNDDANVIVILGVRGRFKF